MSAQPIVFISHSRVKEGKLDDFRQLYRDEVKLVEAEKPGTLVHLFPNADAFDLHMQGTGERAKRSYEFIESDRLEIYGAPSDVALEMIRKIVGSGVALSFSPKNLGGYFRLKSD